MTDIPEFDPNSEAFDPDSDAYDREEIPHKAASTERGTGRRLAIQVLYEVDSAHHPTGEALDYQLEQIAYSAIAREYARELVTNVIAYRDRLDMTIQKYAPEWPLNQVAIIDRNVLRLSLFEFGIGDKVPVSVAINEAVELANIYGAEASPRFVNGVLGALANNLDEVRDLLKQPSEPESEEDIAP